MYIYRPDGRVIEVDDQESCSMLLMKAGWREALPDEVENYVDKKRELLARTAAGSENTDNLPSVYYQTVSSSPDGYGMSRDILKSEIFQRGIMLEEEFKGQKVGLLYSYPTGITQMRTDVRL